MPRQLQAAQVVKGDKADTALTITYLAADTGNKERSPFFPGIVVLAKNVHVSDPYTVTITSADDEHGRTDDITTEAIAAGTTHLFGPFDANGWKQADGDLYFEGSNASIQFAVIDRRL